VPPGKFRLASFVIDRRPQQFNGLKFVKYNRMTAEMTDAQIGTFPVALQLTFFAK